MVDVQVYVCLRSSRHRMTHTKAVRFVTIAAEFVMQNDWHFVDVILLYPHYKVAMV